MSCGGVFQAPPTHITVGQFMSHKNNVVKIGDNFKNRSISQEAMAQIVQKLKYVKSLLWEAQDLHTASHGDTYYFKDEISDKEAEIADFRQVMPKTGVQRKPNTYEKKKLAGDATNKISESSEELAKIIYQDMEGFDD